MSQQTDTAVERETFLDWLNREISLVGDEFIEADGDLEDGDEVVGELTDYLKSLWTVIEKDRKASLEYVEGLAEDEGLSLSGLSAEQKERVEEIRQRAMTLSALFWFEAETHFGIHSDSRRCGIRSGFRLVLMGEKDRGCDCIRCTISRMMSGDIGGIGIHVVGVGIS